MASMDMLPDDLVRQIIADHDKEKPMRHQHHTAECLDRHFMHHAATGGDIEECACPDGPVENEDCTYSDHTEPQKLTAEQKRELVIQGNPEAALRDALARRPAFIDCHRDFGDETKVDYSKYPPGHAPGTPM